MDNGNLIKLIESQSAELAALRVMLEQHVAETRDSLQTLNWKIDRLVEIVDNLNNREHINNRRLSKLEDDVGALKTDVGALKTDVGALKIDVGVLKTNVSVLDGHVSALVADVAAIKVKLSA